MKRFVFHPGIIALILLLTVAVCLLASCGTGEPIVTPGTEEPAKTSTNAKEATITFDTAAEGVTVPSITAPCGSKVTAPEPPAREGYRFDGWLLDGKPYTFGVMPDSDITLTAKWAKLYTITFNTGTNGLTVEPISAAAGDSVIPPAVHRDGYALKYWTLNGSRFDFNEMPGEDVSLSAQWVEVTNLPALLIDLTNDSGQTVQLSRVTRETYVNSTVSLINTDDEYTFTDLSSQFRGRGNGSWSAAKKSYQIKFTNKQSVLGEAANKFWVIIACANFNDVTMSRNYMAYNMAREVFSNLEYSTSAKWVDVYVNGEYRGVYLLCEKVRVADGRLELKSEYGVEDTGYLVEYDAYAKGTEGVDYFRISGVKYAFTVHSPDPEDYSEDGRITQEQYRQQVAYIRDYVAKVYAAALRGDFETFSQLADVDSFVDMYILHELFKNTDTGYSSFYLYKKPGGKLYAGPPWDFDGTTSAARGDNTPQNIYVASATAPRQNQRTSSELYIALYKTEGFRKAVEARWKVLSPQISQFIDARLNEAVYEEYKTAMGKNFVLWNRSNQATAERTWVNNVTALKTWLTSRVTWLNKEWGASA